MTGTRRGDPVEAANVAARRVGTIVPVDAADGADRMVNRGARPAEPPFLDAPARRWVVGCGVLAAALTVAAVPLAAVYSADVLITSYGIVAVALLCEGAEAVDGWWERRTAEAPTRFRPRPLSAAQLMRWVVVALVVYLGVVGLQDIATGAGSGGSGGGPAGGDLIVAGALILGASLASGGLFVADMRRVVLLPRMRPGRPITWFAIATILQALAQNLAPASGASSVRSTITVQQTAGDLIVGSLPYGAIALLAVGPVVRRGLTPWLRRLGFRPVRILWSVGGLAVGLGLVPYFNACFGASTTSPQELLSHLGPLAAVGGLMLWRPVRGAVLEAFRGTTPQDDDDTVDRLPQLSFARRAVLTAALVGVAAAAIDAVGLVVSILSLHLPADCLAQQAAVSQSLSGGPTGRAWYENAGIAMAAGFDEEILFRGVLQPRIGIIASSLLFASFHLQYTCHGLPSVGDLEIVVLGVVFGLLRRRGGLPAAILCHAAYDGAILLNLPV